MRDRLIKILKVCLNDENIETDDGYVGFDVRYENIADYLLANGVIVPPCKVGDMVYVIYNNKVIKGKVDSFDVVIEESDISYVAGIKFFDQIAMVKGFSFGLNVFLTKSQAEEALKK